MGQKMVIEEELQAHERGSPLRQQVVPRFIEDAMMPYQDEELWAAVWVYAYPSINEMGLGAVMAYYYQDSKPASGETDVEYRTRQQKMLAGIELRHHPTSPYALLTLHYREICERHPVEWARKVDTFMHDMVLKHWSGGGFPLTYTDQVTRFATQRLDTVHTAQSLRQNVERILHQQAKDGVLRESQEETIVHPNNLGGIQTRLGWALFGEEARN